mmetsp:Transcript_18324/g.22007  ORF Transcript_18324/g.22007 Transcript_18324/m.22007 type:complete len:87 (+) Transcript_18324:302-562(+)
MEIAGILKANPVKAKHPTKTFPPGDDEEGEVGFPAWASDAAWFRNVCFVGMLVRATCLLNSRCNSGEIFCGAAAAKHNTRDDNIIL